MQTRWRGNEHEEDVLIFNLVKLFTVIVVALLYYCLVRFCIRQVGHVAIAGFVKELLHFSNLNQQIGKRKLSKRNSSCKVFRFKVPGPCVAAVVGSVGRAGQK